MFTHANRCYNRVTEFNIVDFISSIDDRIYLFAVFESMIYGAIKGFLAYVVIKFSKGSFSISKIYQFDRKNRLEIITLSMYDFNEDVNVELIKILEKLESDIDLSSDQIK